MYRENEVNEDLRLMFEEAPLFIQYWTKDFKAIECNKSLIKSFGCTNKEEYIALVASRVDEFLAIQEGRLPNKNPDAYEFAEHLSRHINFAFKYGFASFEHTDIKPDGSTLHAEMVAIRMIYNKEPVVITYGKDITALVQTRKELEYREKMVTALKNVATLLLSDTESFQKHLAQSMQIIAEVVNVQGIHLWKNHFVEEKLFVSLEVKWNLRKAAFADGTLYSYGDILPTWENILKSGIYVNNVVRNMPPKEQEYLSKAGVLSTFVTPIFIKGEFWGFIGFDDHEKERFFTKDEQSILHSASLLIANAFILNETIQNLRETSVQLEQSNKAKGDFLAKMSHEIRTPMNAVIGITEGQLQRGNLEPECREALDKIYNASNTLLNIINDILDISKIEANKIELNSEKYEVSTLIHNVVNINLAHFSGKPVEFQLSVSEYIPKTLIGDELRIKQVLNNILSNAFKYTNDGKIKFSIYPLYDELAPTGGNGNRELSLVLVVSDTGMGMTKEQVNNIFDEYSRFNLEANRKTQGTGLGMNIVHKLVTLMGGDIHVASEVGKGTTVSIRLPQRDAGSGPLGKETAKKLENFRENNLSDIKMVRTYRTPMPYGSVLIVDDNKMNLFVANTLLKPYELSIEVANSGPEAIEKISFGKKYDIVFMDYMMPQMDGIEAAKAIRELGYTLPIVMLTADAVTGRAETFLESGFDAFISKPIDMRQMDVVLKKYIRDNQPCAKRYCHPVCYHFTSGQCVRHT